jgi:hypothetical protein
VLRVAPVLPTAIVIAALRSNMAIGAIGTNRGMVEASPLSTIFSSTEDIIKSFFY